jgi:hypothetical protein
MHGGQSNSMCLEVMVNQQKEKKARHATPGIVTRMDAIFALEREFWGKVPAERLACRQEHAVLERIRSMRWPAAATA